MYFGSIDDKTVKTFTKQVNVNKKYTLNDIIDSDYWNVTDLGTTLKCIPLFHTEEIISSNPDDTVLGTNKCLIAIKDNDTLITCKSSSANPTIIHTANYNLYAYSLDNKTLYCIVTDKYNNLIINEEIEVYKNNTLITTVKTGSDGICKHTTSSTGTYKFTFNEVDSNTIVIEDVNYSITMTCDNPVIESGDTSTVTATLTYEGTGMVGETLSYEVKHNNTVIDSGSDTTDSNGEIEIEYTGTGIGDVDVVVTFGSITEAYIIEDCIFYDATEYAGSSGNYVTIADLSSITLPSQFILSVDYKTNYESRCGLFSKNNFSGNPNYSVFIGTPSRNNLNYWYYGVRTTSTNTTDIIGSPTNYHTYTITRNSDTFNYQRDGSGNYSKSANWFDTYDYVIGMLQWGSGKTAYAKNIKLKAL